MASTNNGEKMIIQIIGLPGSGKTELAKALKERINAIHLNADEVRATVNSDLGFTAEDRIEQARRMGEMARLIAKQNVAPVIVDFVCPTELTRAAFGKPDILIYMETIEKGSLKNAALPYLMDLMRRYNHYFRIDDVTHGNQKKTDRIIWALQGRFEHGKVTLNMGEWNNEFIDQLVNFPNHLLHDDLVDALAYIDQIQVVEYFQDYEDEEFEVIDVISGY